jgi:hypothetical protein
MTLNAFGRDAAPVWNVGPPGSFSMSARRSTAVMKAPDQAFGSVTPQDETGATRFRRTLKEDM